MNEYFISQFTSPTFKQRSNGLIYKCKSLPDSVFLINDMYYISYNITNKHVFVEHPNGKWEISCLNVKSKKFIADLMEFINL